MEGSIERPLRRPEPEVGECRQQLTFGPRHLAAQMQARQPMLDDVTRRRSPEQARPLRDEHQPRHRDGGSHAGSRAPQ